MITGEDGILKKTVDATERTLDAEEEERVKRTVGTALADGLSNVTRTLSTENVRKALENEFGEDKVKDNFTGNGPWTFKGERKSYQIEKNGKVGIYTPPLDPTDIYVALYGDGTLVFSSKKEKLTEGEQYDNIRGIKYSSSKLPPWYGSRTQITKVKFIDAIAPEYTSYWFYLCSNLEKIENIENLDTNNVTTMQDMFSNCEVLTDLDLKNFNTGKVTSMYEMFKKCKGLVSLDLTSFDTENVTDMKHMFQECSSLTNLNLSSFNTEKVGSMCGMFERCGALISLNLDNFDTPCLKGQGTMNMFAYCVNLRELRISNLDTRSVYQFTGMFRSCFSLQHLDLDNFDTWTANRMDSMFSGCSSLRSLDVGHFNTSSVTNMAGLFQDCSSLVSLDLTRWNTSRVSSMESMFKGCKSLTALNLSNFDTRRVTDMTNMFWNCSGMSKSDILKGEFWDESNASTAGMYLNMRDANT